MKILLKSSHEEEFPPSLAWHAAILPISAVAGYLHTTGAEFGVTYTGSPSSPSEILPQLLSGGHPSSLQRI